MSDGMKRSRKQEKRGAKDFGGWVNPRSGAGDWHKNDVRTEKLSIEYKTTTKKQFTLKLEDLLLAEKHALLAGRDFVFVIEMGGREFAITSKEFLLDTLGGPEW